MNPKKATRQTIPAPKIPSGVDERVAQKLLEGLLEGATFKEMYDISDETMEAVYAQAYEFYQSGRLDDAESLFRWLCVYDFYNVDYVVGFGAVLQLKKNYAKALDVYGLAYAISRGEARILLYAGQCNLRLRRWAKARKCFQTILEDAAACETVSAKARAYLAAIASQPTKTDNGEREEEPIFDMPIFGEKA
jgi:type III secretion system low calcium response chaperone LcrH/SycD